MIFTWCPAFGVNVSKQPRVKKAQFGDGYAQRAADGINTQPRSYNVQFNANSGKVEDIDQFLSDRAGIESFTWTPFDGIEGTFICEAWNLSRTGPTAGTLSATFMEVYGET